MTGFALQRAPMTPYWSIRAGNLPNRDQPEQIARLEERQAFGLKDRVQFHIAQPGVGRRLARVDAGRLQLAQVAPIWRRPLVQALDRVGPYHNAENRHRETRLNEPAKNPRQ